MYYVFGLGCAPWKQICLDVLHYDVSGKLYCVYVYYVFVCFEYVYCVHVYCFYMYCVYVYRVYV